MSDRLSRQSTDGANWPEIQFRGEEMDATRWRLIRSLFDELADVDPGMWDAMLRARCPEDAILRDEVLHMLAADREGRDMPSRLAAQTPELLNDIADAEEARQSSCWIGRELGVWRIVSSLGCGGMGMVYLAERQSGDFRQHAAIKLLRASDDAVGLQRFLAERQILANLEHPNIARLLDGGREPDGTPWFALEYVDGMRLTEWCDDRRLGIRERLRLFREVCAAVSYAHERLIVHRDLKPANILVDTSGQVKLLDFGIAKLLEQDAEQTGTALRAFTPEYAAPEQVRGERMTTAVDVYALGVVLYELLTGRRPYRITERSALAIERAVLDQRPTRPSAALDQADVNSMPGTDTGQSATNRGLTPVGLRMLLRGDLDAIVMKALRKEPDARYASVHEFSEDIRAMLSSRPVAARHGGRRYVAARFLRRNALSMVLALLTVVALCTGLLAALWQAREARLQRDTARQSLSFMTDLFRNADPAMRERADLSLRDLLDQGVRDMDVAFPEQGEARMELLIAMASAYMGLDLPELGEPLLQNAKRIAESSGDRVALARIVVEDCGGRLFRRKWGNCDASIAAVETLLDNDNPEHVRIVATALDRQAQERSRSSLFEESVVIARRGLALLGPGPDTLRERSDLIGTTQYSLVALGRRDEAEALVRPLLEELRTSSRVPPRLLADALGNLANTLQGTGRDSEMLEMQREALAVLESLYGKDHPLTMTQLNNLATYLYTTQHLEEARELMVRVVAIRRANPSSDKAFIANSLGNLGAIELQLGSDESARTLLEESLQIYSTFDVPRQRAIFLRWHAIVLLLQGRLDEADRDIAEGKQIMQELFDKSEPRVLRFQSLRQVSALAKASRPFPAATCAAITDTAQAFSRSSEAAGPDASFAGFLLTFCRETKPAATTAFESLRARLSDTDYRVRLALQLLAKGD